MEVGDLVKRRPVWGEWVERNPWMISEKDLEVGVILEIHEHLAPPRIVIMWSTGKIEKDWEEYLELVNESG